VNFWELCGILICVT